jgi:hypothetical protein
LIFYLQPRKDIRSVHARQHCYKEQKKKKVKRREIAPQKRDKSFYVAFVKECCS